jgi:hypothetical protein
MILRIKIDEWDDWYDFAKIEKLEKKENAEFSFYLKIKELILL